jgi:hypothetical protein
MFTNSINLDQLRRKIQHQEISEISTRTAALSRNILNQRQHAEQTKVIRNHNFVTVVVLMALAALCRYAKHLTYCMMSG